MRHYFDESFRQLNTAIAMPISAVIGPMIDQVVVLLIGLPPSTPNPWSAQIRPNSATINPTASVTTKPLFIFGCYAPEDRRVPGVVRAYIERASVQRQDHHCSLPPHQRDPSHHIVVHAAQTQRSTLRARAGTPCVWEPQRGTDLEVQ